MSEAILGTIYRTEAGSITGWCWNPARPASQCAIEVLIDGSVWRQLTADRRHEGARLNGPPHDHFGYLVTPPPPPPRGWHRVEIRERRSGQVFGRLMQGGADLGSELLAARIDAVRGQAALLAGQLERMVAPVAVAAGFGAVGAALGGMRLPAVSLPEPAAPAVSVIVIGCDDLAAAHRAVTALALTAVDEAAEILLAGDPDRGRLAEIGQIMRGVRLLGRCPPWQALVSARGDRIIVQNRAGEVLLQIRRPDLQAMAVDDAGGWDETVADIIEQANLLGMEIGTC